MRAVLVFCEGNHDIAFVSRSLGAITSAKWLGGRISDLPSPFGPLNDPKNPHKPKVESIIAQRYARRSLTDLNIRAAAHPPPPAFEALVSLPTDDTLYCLVRCHGDGAAKSAGELLVDLMSLLPFGVDVTEFAAAFIFDADDGGVAVRETLFAKAYAPCLTAGLAPQHGFWVKGNNCPIGLFVFHDLATGKGTLEATLSLLLEAEWPDRWKAAGDYLTKFALPHEPVSTKGSEMYKAQICVTGQFRFPGDPMTLVLGREGLPPAHFQGPVSQDLVRFLRAVPWQRTQQAILSSS